MQAAVFDRLGGQASTCACWSKMEPVAVDLMADQIPQMIKGVKK